MGICCKDLSSETRKPLQNLTKIEMKKLMGQLNLVSISSWCSYWFLLDKKTFFLTWDHLFPHLSIHSFIHSFISLFIKDVHSQRTHRWPTWPCFLPANARKSVSSMVDYRRASSQFTWNRFPFLSSSPFSGFLVVILSHTSSVLWTSHASWNLQDIMKKYGRPIRSKI